MKLALIFILTAVLFGCGKGFSTKKQDSVPAPDKNPGPISSGLPDSFYDESPYAKLSDQQFEEKIKEVREKQKEKWLQDIPEKYDDVGEFYRVKSIPGISENQVIDSVSYPVVTTSSPKVTATSTQKTLNLIRGKLKFENIKHKLSSDKTIVEIEGQMVFKDKENSQLKPMPFVLKGAYKESEMALTVEDIKSPLFHLLKAKATCTETSADACMSLTIDFYYEVKSKEGTNFYTDQLISKSSLASEIQNPYEEFTTPDIFYQKTPDEDLTDYEKKLKKGKLYQKTLTLEEVETVKDLPSYYVVPTMDDVAILFPEYKPVIQSKKEAEIAKKVNKKKVTLPELKGEEVIPDTEVKIGPPPPLDDGKSHKVKGDTVAKEEPKATVTPSKDVAKTTEPVVVTDKKNQTPPKVPVIVKPEPVVVPKAEPPKKQAPEKILVKEDRGVIENKNRPINQAIKWTHNGYLVNATSLLEAIQKIGPSINVSLLNPGKLRHYGTYDIVDLIVNVGEWVKENTDGFILKVSDISAKKGGYIGHSSHRTGMDADISYITKTQKMAFMDLDRVRGQFTHPDFDGAKQWKLFKEAFDMAPIEVIYVNRKIKNEMCRQALLAGDLKSNTDSKSEAAQVLTRLIVIDSNHGDHWHVRMDCLTLKRMGLQKQCYPWNQPFRGPECQNISIK
ncbi:MAG: penicillin-insensitive murein endopeptidase [Bdellovibrionaceae bacterium]|nr:penicillin-insensitive murein endopeptidase [Pseudobdellovibrionaceae bacterium]NUM58675.1 penicillin-insensitive murein endopeptidase [Pseudobdellovibrionaceae bacterium]